MRPVDVATSDTVKFIQANLPPGSRRLLEVGCGRGEVALALQDLGYEVIALDADATSVETAKNSGVDARLVHWPDFEDAPFDTILFTRSLHHIGPLAEAVEHTKRLLLPGGKVIVEDFDYEAFDRKTSEWVYGLALILKSSGMFHEVEGILKSFVEKGGPFDLWQQWRGHDLHPLSAMRSRLQGVFSQVAEETTTNMYRYFLPNLPQDDQGYAIAQNIFEAEKRLGEAGGIMLIGRRFVAHS